MLKTGVCLISLFVNGLAFSQEKIDLKDPTLRNVFDQDDRSPITSTDFPWSAIGKLKSDHGSCSGTLVGEDLVLTNRHCVRGDDKALYTNIRFYPNYIDGRANLMSEPNWIWWDETYDWAVLRLRQPLGKSQGFLGTRHLNFSNAGVLSGTFHAAGYSGDFRGGETAGVHMNCKFTDYFSYGILKHSCDTTRGSSGGPIFGKWGNNVQIVALNYAEGRDGETSHIGIPYSPEKANYAIEIAKVSNMIIKRRQDDEGKSPNTFMDLCNKSGYGVIFAAIAARGTDNSWYTQGWFKLEDGECKEVNVSSHSSDLVYIYAEQNGGAKSWQNGTTQLCVNRSEAFNLKVGSPCDDSSLKMVNFSEAYKVERDRVNIYNFLP